MKVRTSIAAAVVAVAAAATLTPAQAAVGISAPGQKALGVAVRGQAFRVFNGTLSPQTYTINGVNRTAGPREAALYEGSLTQSWQAVEPVAINGQTAPGQTVIVVG